MVTLRVTVPGTAGLLPTVAVPFRIHSQQQRVTVPIPVHAPVCPVTTATLTVVVKHISKQCSQVAQSFLEAALTRMRVCPSHPRSE